MEQTHILSLLIILALVLWMARAIFKGIQSAGRRGDGQTQKDEKTASCDAGG